MSIRRFASAATTYVGSSAFVGLMPLILLPVLTRFLETSDYGVIAVFGATFSITQMLAGLQGQAAAVRRYYDADEIDFPVYVGGVVRTWALTAVVVGALAAPLAWVLGPRLQVEPWVIGLAMGAGVIAFPNQLRLALWRAQSRAKAFATMQIGLALATATGTLLLVMVFGWDWRGPVTAQATATAIVGLACLPLLAKQGLLKFRVEPEYVRNALRYGLPLLPHGLATLAMLHTGRLALAGSPNIDMGTVGLFSTGLQVSVALDRLTTAVGGAYAPWLMGRLKAGSEEAKRQVKLVQTGMVVGAIVLGVLGVLLVGPAFRLLLGEAFHASIPYAQWFVVAGALQLVYYVRSSLVLYTGNNKILGLTSSSVAVLHVGAVLVGIHLFGPIGAAAAYVGARAIMATMVFVYTRGPIDVTEAKVK